MTASNMGNIPAVTGEGRIKCIPIEGGVLGYLILHLWSVFGGVCVSPLSHD
jgi:hypothetical protein